MNPISKMIDQAVRCVCCNTQGYGKCLCWETEKTFCTKCKKCRVHCGCKRYKPSRVNFASHMGMLKVKS